MSLSVEDRARALVETGALNWPGPATIVLRVSGGGASMTPATAKACVDAAFSTPRPALTLELDDAEGTGWRAAWLALEYAARRAEWGNRGLGVVYRTPARPSPARAQRLAERRAVVRAALRADGPPSTSALFPALRARVLVGAGAKDGAGWADALADARVEGVEWVRDGLAPAAFAAFCRAALRRMMERADESDLRDELVLALLAARPWEVPGVDLLETLCFAPDGSVFSSEDGLEAAAKGDGRFALGHAATFRFQDLPSFPIVPALLSSAVNAGQPLCAGCSYKTRCAIAPSRHFRDQGSLAGRLPDSPSCLLRLSVLDEVFTRLHDEKCLKALQKWGVDSALLSC